MAGYAGSVQYTGWIAPGDTTDTFAVTDERFNRGGYRSVANEAARLAITPDRRAIDMLVKQSDTNVYWTLRGGILDTNWQTTLDTISGIAESAVIFTDITTGNSSTTNHGFAPKLPNDVTKFYNGIGGWTTPPGESSITGLTSNYLPKWNGSVLVNSKITDDGTIQKYNGNTIWNAGNDGHGSGLDADLLDGTQLSNVMAVKRSLFNNEDMNTIREVGTYVNIVGNGSGNSNFHTNYGILNVYGDGSNYGEIQASYDANFNGELSYRMFWGSWLSWRKSWDDKNSNLSTEDWNAKNMSVAGNLIVNGTTVITRPTTELIYSATNKTTNWTTVIVNGRREGKTNTINIIAYVNTVSAAVQCIGTISNYISPGYTVYFAASLANIGAMESCYGYITTNGLIYITPSKEGTYVSANVTWITE